MPLKLPVFVVEGNDLSVYNTLKRVQNQLEPQDVLKQVYEGYDAEGRLLSLKVERRRVVISLAEENPTHTKTLENAIRNYLRAANDPLGDDESCDLNCLVTACIKFAS
jgi:hypothetical protein